MLPLELKIDKDGLLYIDSSDELFRRILLLDQRENKDDYYASIFNSLDSTDDYIVKRPVTILTRKERELYKEFLFRLVNKQKDITRTDFPIGYLREKKKLAGLIVKYYKEGISLDNITKEEDINLIGKYYYHDEDNIHNLFLIFEEIIDVLEEMFENDVYYTDVNDGNFIVTNNQIKVIDFDPFYVKFDGKDKSLERILENFIKLINVVLKKYQLSCMYRDNIQNFREAKKYTKKLENAVRR